MKTETYVYVVSVEALEEKFHKDLSDAEFMQIADLDGSVYTLANFQEAFNSEDVSTTVDIVRFINVPIETKEISNRILKFEVAIAFSDTITDQEDIMIVAENIARAIKSEADSGEGIAPENTDAITQIVEVKLLNTNEGVTLKIY